MKQATLYFAGRAVDIFTTWLNVRASGYEVEASPVGRFSMETFGFMGFIITNLLISTLVFLAIKRFGRPWLMTVAVVSFYVVAVWNLVIYALIV